MSVYTITNDRNLLNEDKVTADVNTRNQYNATIVGFEAAVGNQGKLNTFVGYRAGSKVMYAQQNTFLGANTGRTTLGNDNVLVGCKAGELITSANRNILIGTTTGQNLLGDQNILIGYANTPDTLTMNNNIGIGPVQRIGGEKNISLGNRNYVDGFNSLSFGNKITNEGSSSILIGNSIRNTGSNACIIYSYGSNANVFDDNVYNSNDFYTNINDFITHHRNGITLKEDASFTATDNIQIKSSNIILMGNTKFTNTVTFADAQFTSNISLLGELDFCYQAFGNTHWKVLLNNTHEQASDLILTSKNGTTVCFTDDFASELLNFTGKHRCDVETKTIEAYARYQGRIVSSTGTYAGLDASTFPDIDEALPCIRLSNKVMDPCVFGVVCGVEDDDGSRNFRLGNMQFKHSLGEKNNRKVIVNSHGEGGIWVCNINGNLRNGDLITSSGICGYGMLQPSHVCMSYTVAKITCDCDFDISSTVYKCKYFKWRNKLLMKAFVGCVYKI